MLGAQLECVREVLRGRFRREFGAELQLSLSSRAIHGGAYFSDVSG